MKKSVLRLSAVLLVVCLLFPVSLVYTGGNSGSANAVTDVLAGAENEKTDVAENTEETTAPVVSIPKGAAFNPGKPASDPEILPTIIIPGIMQSDVILLDENGNRIVDDEGYYKVAFIEPDVGSIVKTLIGPLFNALIFKQMDGLYKAIDEVAADLTKNISNDLNGQPGVPREVIKYPNSYADSTPYEQERMLSTIPLHDYIDAVSGENLYFFTYDSFGNQLEIAADLYQFIEKVKAERNSDKVNLVPISLGATVFNSLMDVYPQVKESLNKVVLVVPAANGSKIAAGVFRGQFTRNEEDIYKNLLPSLVDGYTGFALNLLIRILPKQTLLNVLDAVMCAVRDNLKTCTNMWALVPNEDYIELRDTLLDSDEYAAIREQTDRYYTAQGNRYENIQSFIESGVRFFCIAEYNFPTYGFIPNWNDHNSDGLLPLESASLGAYAAPIGQTLPEGYVQKNTSPYISDPTHNYISPDNVVDASAGLLPDTTWYFKDQNHEATGRNDVIISLTSTLISSNRIQNIFSDPKYPQFLVARNARGLKQSMLPKALDIDTSALSPEDAAALQEAIDEVIAVLDNPLADQDAINAANNKLLAVFVKLGLASAPKPESTTDKLLYSFFKTASDMTYKFLGGKGYFDLKG